MTRHLLVFPVSVVVLAFVSFVFGGHCAAWQWWAAIVATVASGFWRSTAKEGIRVAEVAISYRPRTFSEDKKIGWRDGFRALWCIVRYNLWK